MEKIPFNITDVTAEHSGVSSAERRARLERAVQEVVVIHKANLGEFTPKSAPGMGGDPDIDAGRQAIWRLDGEILELDISGWH